MNPNYITIALVLMAAIILLIIIIRKNRADRKKFEQQMNREDIEPEQHKSDSI